MVLECWPTHEQISNKFTSFSIWHSHNSRADVPMRRWLKFYLFTFILFILFITIASIWTPFQQLSSILFQWCDKSNPKLCEWTNVGNQVWHGKFLQIQTVGQNLFHAPCSLSNECIFFFAFLMVLVGFPRRVGEGGGGNYKRVLCWLTDWHLGIDWFLALEASHFLFIYLFIFSFVPSHCFYVLLVLTGLDGKAILYRLYKYPVGLNRTRQVATSIGWPNRSQRALRASYTGFLNMPRNLTEQQQQQQQ